MIVFILVAIMEYLKVLLFSHATCFVGGVLVGKSIDADELAVYRSANADATSAWIKRSLMIGAGVVLAFMGVGSFTKMGGGKRLE
mmetsp:Transcript_20589/g.30176  ORF Transcript_20589/g.30176 Transcript_20589/m.30176 type:complete len:85 (-) Transcript_20589:1483-1737(-)